MTKPTSFRLPEPLRITTANLESITRPARLQNEMAEATKFLAELQRSSLARSVAQALTRSIAQFDTKLDVDHEVGMKLVSFGQTVTFHVEGLGYANPNLLFFRGTTPDGNRVELIQHVSQISFLLIAIPKPDPNQPKRPFGFHMPERQESERAAEVEDSSC